MSSLVRFFFCRRYEQAIRDRAARIEALSALEPAAPEDHKAASAASVDPDGIWERAYAETAGVQPANETRQGKSRGEPHKHGPNDEPGSLAAEQSGETGPGASGGQEPVAWRCKDYADGWVVYGEKSAADRHQRNDGCLMQPLYTRPSEQAVTEAALRDAARRIVPYLRWTISDESPGHHPTMPSAVGAFMTAFGWDTEEKWREDQRSFLKAAMEAGR